MILYRDGRGWLVEKDGKWFSMGAASLDALMGHEDLYGYLAEIAYRATPLVFDDLPSLAAPIESQEVWAAGVTYYRSRSARMEESKNAGGGDFYDRVYSAERPELFFKAIGSKVAGPNSPVRIRTDAKWSVPEPELTLAINPRGEIVGYTIGNDMSSRDIEGENPLYLPQAKVYDRSCALGPGILIQKAMRGDTQIALQITRGGTIEFSAAIALSEMKRDPQTLVEYLYRDQSFPYGCFLMTGTGIVPTDSFTLQRGDEISISISSIGALVNRVA